MAPHGARGQGGFTIAEVLLALVLLSFMVLGFQAVTGEIIHYAAQSDRRAVALQLVQNRLDVIRLDEEYALLVPRYRETETTFAGYPGLARTTQVERTQAAQERGVLDFTTITVTVDGAAVRDPVSRTIVVAAP